MISASVPASTILFGEHAVLYGQPAIATALNHRISVFFEADHTTVLSIQSSLAHYTAPLENFGSHPKLRFVCRALQQHPPPSGGKLTIQSDIDATIGLGSSAAVTVAVLSCMAVANQQLLVHSELLKQALNVIRGVQQKASGTDAAASLYGGCIWYDPTTLSVTPLQTILPPLSLHYCGHKTPTPEVIQYVDKRWQQHQAAQQRLYLCMGNITQRARYALESNQSIAALMNAYHEQLVKLGVEDTALKTLRQTLLAQGAQGVKISGSGLGDCLLAQHSACNPNQLPLTIDPQGLCIT